MIRRERLTRNFFRGFRPENLHRPFVVVTATAGLTASATGVDSSTGSGSCISSLSSDATIASDYRGQLQTTHSLVWRSTRNIFFRLCLFLADRTGSSVSFVIAGTVVADEFAIRDVAFPFAVTVFFERRSDKTGEAGLAGLSGSSSCPRQHQLRPHNANSLTYT